jgi:hypothetical protein
MEELNRSDFRCLRITTPYIYIDDDQKQCKVNADTAHIHFPDYPDLDGLVIYISGWSSISVKALEFRGCFRSRKIVDLPAMWNTAPYEVDGFRLIGKRLSFTLEAFGARPDVRITFANCQWRAEYKYRSDG